MRRPRTWGMRFSRMDAVAIFAMAIAAVALWPAVGGLALVGPFALGHFFLFCNVFRVRRRLEIGWAAAFVANCAMWVTFAEGWSWAAVFAVQLPITIAVIASEIRSPRYHGVRANRWNPRLHEYLDGKH